MSVSTHALIRELRRIFLATPEVQFARPFIRGNLIFETHNADLVIQTWMGTRVYLYLVSQPQKLRSLRTQVAENTSRDVGSLFMVDMRLLPESDTHTQLPKWLDAIRLLNNGWIYGYAHDEGDVIITQIHFVETPRADMYFCWHHPNFQIETVNVRRRTLTDVMPGKWKIADIATVQFRRTIHHERVHQRFHYRTKQTQPIEMVAPGELQRIYDLLGISANASPSEAKRAYRQMALKVHPDTSSLPTTEAEKKFKSLAQAYETLRRYKDWV